MNVELPSFIFTFLGVAGGAGVAWGTTRQQLKRVQSDLKDLEKDVVDHEASDVAQHAIVIDRLARIETLLTHIDKRLP